MIKVYVRNEWDAYELTADADGAHLQSIDDCEYPEEICDDIAHRYSWPIVTFDGVIRHYTDAEWAALEPEDPAHEYGQADFELWDGVWRQTTPPDLLALGAITVENGSSNTESA